MTGGYFAGHRPDCPCYGCFIARGWWPSVADEREPSHRDLNWVCFACSAPLTLNADRWECSCCRDAHTDRCPHS